MIIQRHNIPTALIQQPTVLGWRLPAYGFFVYSMIATGALILNARSFLVIGGGIMFLCVCTAWCRRIMAVSVDKSIFAVICIMLLSIFATLYDPTNTVFHNLFKHISICILYIFIFSMGLAPIYSTPFRSIFVFVLLFMGVASFAFPGINQTDDVMRMSGLFSNANNLSLAMLTLLFLINEDKDSRAKKISIHAILILFLLLSGTSGAILAYLGAMFFKYFTFLKTFSKYRNKWILVLIGIVAVSLGLLITTHMFMDVPIVNRIVTQLSLIWHELPVAASGYELDYGNLMRTYGTSDCSGIWRISHWRSCIDVIAEADTVQLLCGHGIGASSLLLYKVPHNDYLRVLMEQGIIGLMLYAAFFLTVFRRIDRRYRYCIVAVALYCLSENNMDNLLFMSIFVFFLASAQNKASIQPATAQQ